MLSRLKRSLRERATKAAAIKANASSSYEVGENEHRVVCFCWVRAIHNFVHRGVGPILFLAFAAMLLLTLSRLLLTLWQYDQLPPESGAAAWAHILFQGVRVDFASICALFALPMLVLTLVSMIPFIKVHRFIITAIKAYCALCLAFLLMNEAATPGFILEYGVRPNHIYVQYLEYPREIFATLWHGHKVALLLSIVGTALTVVAGWKLGSWAFQGYEQSSKLVAVTALVFTVAIVPLGIRSTLGHRPLNPAMVAFTNNSLVNTLPLNSSYSAIYAFAHLKDSQVSESQIYAKVTPEQALSSIGSLSNRSEPAVFDPHCPINQRVRAFAGLYSGISNGNSTETSRDQFAASGIDAGSMSTIHGPIPVLSRMSSAEPLLNMSESEREGSLQRAMHSVMPMQPYNVVVILEESLGDNFVASQGGVPMTPNFESLRADGWWFENMYAAGHRSIRGIEAVTASMPPSALQSIVKLPFPKDPYATLAEIFKRSGYATSFIYGGESHFDNMRSYFLDNGMDEVVEQKDYQNPSFVASWGVSDEDLFARANQVFREHFKNGQLFFSVVFSSSFHDPFDIPEGKVSLDGFPTEEPARMLAAKYADYALGQFFAQAKQEDYYNHTVFLVIADHESRVRGSGDFPLHDFTIPAVIIAPNVLPHTDSREVSQIDMGLTLLSLAGIEGEVPNVGQNLVDPKAKSRALMQFNNIFGLLEGDKFLALEPERLPTLYSVVRHETLANPHEASTDAEKDMVSRGINYSNLGITMYNKQLLTSNCIKLDHVFDSTPHHILASPVRHNKDAEPESEAKVRVAESK